MTMASYPPPPPPPVRERSKTMHSWPPPPPPGSIVPPAPAAAESVASTPASIAPIPQERPSGVRPRFNSEVLELTDGDILVEKAPPALPSPGRTELWQVARLGAALLGGVLSARAVVVHAYDPASGMLRIIGADGLGIDLLGETCRADDDLVGSTILGNERLLKLRFEDGVPRSAPERLRAMGAKRSLLAVPVVDATAGCVAILEVIDADEALDGHAAEACERAAKALARCIGPRTSA